MSAAAAPVPRAGPRRGGRRVALVARYPARDPALPQFISNHGMRMVEASLRAAGIDGLELRTWDLADASVEELARELLGFDPDVVGFSSYLWSFPFFLEVADRVAQDDPRRLVVFGGPAARPSMLSLPAHRWAKRCIDALAVSDGEATFREIVALRDRSDAALAEVAGLALPRGDGWVETPARAQPDLNELANPYRMGLVPRGGLGVVQSYRGCPFTCSFCEWGTLESPRRVLGADLLAAELEAIARNRVDGVLLVDAGLNLNPHAFAQLREAAERTGFFRERHLICEVYPARVRKEHVEFLAGVGRPMVGVGLQSFDTSVLRNVDRSYDETRFEDTLRELGQVAHVTVEVIMGLPGDDPRRFRANFERARRLPCALRVYHCVVLPSALMVRAPESYQLAYDPYTLKLRSGLGWSEADVEETRAFLSAQAAREGGRIGEFFWIFPPPRSAPC